MPTGSLRATMPSVTYRAPGLVLTEHEIEVPLDHADPRGAQITLFGREVADPDGRDKPFLLFLQGGPGFEAPRPSAQPSGPAWLERALQDFRVLMLDQRGTGRSTPVGALPGMSAEEQAGYLSHFRADSIVRDSECLREALGVERWSVLGQSFGGFCLLTYLSIAGEAVGEAFFTGGLPAIGRHIDEVYGETYATLLERNRRFYERYPEDLERIRSLVRHLDTNEVRLPTGDRLTARRLRQAGNVLGRSDGAEALHYVLELPTASPGFLHDAAGSMEFERNPLYAVLHEASWADGQATRWAAERVMPAEFRECQELLTAEHVFPWMFEDIAALRPLRDAAELLARRDWPRLYDPDVLASNETPAAAAIYVHDLYVPRRFSEETAIGVRGLRTWITDEYEHNGLRADGGRILGRLIDLVRGRA